jgi:hypothetical protein
VFSHKFFVLINGRSPCERKLPVGQRKSNPMFTVYAKLGVVYKLPQFLFIYRLYKLPCPTVGVVVKLKRTGFSILDLAAKYLAKT